MAYDFALVYDVARRAIKDAETIPAQRDAISKGFVYIVSLPDNLAVKSAQLRGEEIPDSAYGGTVMEHAIKSKKQSRAFGFPVAYADLGKLLTFGGEMQGRPSHAIATEGQIVNFLEGQKTKSAAIRAQDNSARNPGSVVLGQGAADQKMLRKLAAEVIKQTKEAEGK